MPDYRFVNRVLANPIVFRYKKTGVLTVPLNKLSFSALNQIAGHFDVNAYGEPLDGSSEVPELIRDIRPHYSTIFTKSGVCKLKVSWGGRKNFTVVHITGVGNRKQLREILKRPWLTYGANGVKLRTSRGISFGVWCGGMESNRVDY